ncbi:13622_t:CDS:2 [Cetraspora pellucida]|uniref:13622_t:CDS:1 n=1 Tax=Cetraspora pellucida TaxID=1433469 RepID=A0ACA9K7J3_9GLOM|nr:13622_t:CDS:2 [Cetraspora pellucida]
MYKTNSGFYVIDVLPLHHASKRPFHLERRMKSKKSTTHVHGHGHKKLPQCAPDDARIKREALLEQRRLKLARQTLHVKEVLMKQHERALNDSFTKRSQIQQTLQVAEKNRNTILQRLVEQCAQEVARCKEVARQQQLKIQEEIDRRRADLERRQKATAARRARLLSISKSHAQVNGSSPNYTRDEAATIIQTNWRYKHLIDVIKTYRSFGISIHTIKNMSFRDAVGLLKENSVIQATNKFLQRVRKSSSITLGVSKYKNPARVFLSAYMIVAHTKEILVDVGHHEKTLLNSSETMLKELEQWFSEIDNDNSNRISYNNILSFLSAWDTYYKDFNTWKSKDSEKLANNLITHYMELEKLWNTVKNQANAETEWRMNIVEQQEEIRRKIRNLGGDEAMAKLERVLKRLKAKLPIVDGENVDVTDSVTGAVNDQENDHKEQDSDLPPRQSFVPQTLAADGSVELANPSPQSITTSTNTSTSQNQSATNANLYHIIQSLGGSQVNSGLTNEQLAHEIIIDPDFELKPPKLSELEERVRNMATKAFFDSVRADFEQGRYERWVPELLSDIKQRLLDLVPPTSSLHSSINEVLDIDLITQQTKAGVYNIHNCIVFITNTMLQICAPIRDEEIQGLKDLNDLAEIFQKLLNILDQMRLDLANYLVKAFRPYLKEHAIEYERRKFELALQSKRITLDLTKSWIKQTVDSLLRTRAERNPENIHLPQHRHNYGIKFNQVFNESFVSSIFQPSIIDKSNCPETLLLDIERLWNYQNEGQAITIVAALLMLTKNVAGAKVNNAPDDLTTLKDTLFVLLMDGDTTIDNLTAEILACFPSTLSSETQTLIKSMVSKTLSQSDKVFSLLSRRIQNIMKQHLQTGQFPKKETLTQHGVIAVAKELEQLSRKICILGRYNREVYAYWYDTIIREQLQEVGETNKTDKEQSDKGKSKENEN